jgi:hypothetical protein
MVGRGRVYVPFQLPNLREIKDKIKHLDSYSDAQTNASKPLSLTQTFELTRKDIMLLLDQTLVSLEKQWVWPRPLRLENDSHLQ